jgi:hypothetical protein
LTGAEVEGSDIPAAVPMQRSTPEVPEAAGGAPEQMEVAAMEAAMATGGESRHQSLLWRWLSAPWRYKTQSPSALL